MMPVEHLLLITRSLLLELLHPYLFLGYGVRNPGHIANLESAK
jgi:hypothetical protein